MTEPCIHGKDPQEGCSSCAKASVRWLISITVQIPYPKTYEFREGGSNVGVAIGRAYRQFRKLVKGKRLNDGALKWIKI